MANLAQVRRLEAVSFRSFPANSTHYDGTWAIRLTAGHPAKRLNSVNPLDPSDHAYIEARIELARKKFEQFGRPLVFRQSPLVPPELEETLDKMGWERFDESSVMLLNLEYFNPNEFGEPVLEHDVGKWVDGFIKLSDEELSSKPGLVEVISSIQPKSGMFINFSGDHEIAALRCVQDNDLAGVFDVVTGKNYLRQGRSKALLGSALRWAKAQGAKVAWLQVVSNNEAAIRLYESFGFEEFYRYSYRRLGTMVDAQIRQEDCGCQCMCTTGSRQQSVAGPASRGKINGWIMGVSRW